MTIPSELWPNSDLEQVPLCPVCSCEQRTLLYRDLADVTFSTSPGRWQLWRCATCASAWLDPRPSAASIQRAYGQYYTHNETQLQPSGGSGLRSKLGNGYRNWRYGSSLEPALGFGRYVMPAFRSVQRLNELMYRYLPRRPESAEWAVLDVGCGNGDFLRSASELGWRCYGVEPDPNARVLAQKQGFEIVSDLNALRKSRQQFHAITLSHVIEHLHEPANVMMQVASLLVPGGHLFIATPNLSSIGHLTYGRHWRGLEIPRHLVLFNQVSLKALLSRTGFEHCRFHAQPDAIDFTEKQSRRISAGFDPYDEEAPLSGPQVPENERHIAAGNGPNAEYLIVTSRRAKK